MSNAKNLAITQRLLYPYRRVITPDGETGRIARRDGGPWRSHDGDIFLAVVYAIAGAFAWVSWGAAGPLWLALCGVIASGMFLASQWRTFKGP